MRYFIIQMCLYIVYHSKHTKAKTFVQIQLRKSCRSQTLRLLLSLYLSKFFGVHTAGSSQRMSIFSLGTHKLKQTGRNKNTFTKNGYGGDNSVYGRIWMDSNRKRIYSWNIKIDKATHLYLKSYKAWDNRSILLFNLKTSQR